MSLDKSSNDDYLRVVLTWLRLRLLLLDSNRQQSTSTLEDEILLAEIEVELEEWEEALPRLPIFILSERLALSRFERNTLMLCVAMEMDTRLPGLCALADGNGKQPYPTFALAFTLFNEPSWDILSPHRPLRFWRLIEINDKQFLPLTSSPLRAEERIVNYIKGVTYLDARLASLLTPLVVDNSRLELPPSQSETVDHALWQLKSSGSQHSLPLVQLMGRDASSKRLIASHIASQFGLKVYRLPINLLPNHTDDLEMLGRLWQRESLLFPLSLYLDAQEIDEGNLRTLGIIDHLLTRGNGLFFLATRDRIQGLSRVTLDYDVSKPTPFEQQAAWRSILGEEQAELAMYLSGQFNLNFAQITEIGQSVTQDEHRFEEQLWAECLARTRPRLDSLAQRLEPKATWDDLVVPDEVHTMLQQITDQVRHRGKVYDDWGFRHRATRGLGLVSLFSGESGTGKTMAAEVIANELNLNLYRIDLSAVVSKYIGETEKNLRQLFDAAEDGGVILFFDEADALFGKRSQVKDSHDRYANIETNYLLQRLEAFQGLAILATNMKSSLDEAFTRRIRFILNFPFPDVEHRIQIWRKVFPQETPLGDIDYTRLAQFNLAGGSIYNSALNATFLAASKGGHVSMSHILSAIRTEFLKSDRLLDENSFALNYHNGNIREE